MVSSLSAVLLLFCLIPALYVPPTTSQACILLTTHTLNHTPSFSALITDSVHDPDTTISKLTAELCLHCISHISQELAHSILEQGLDHINSSKTEGLLEYREEKYMTKGADMRLTPGEEELMRVILSMRAGNWQDYESPQDSTSHTETLQAPPRNWEL